MIFYEILLCYSTVSLKLFDWVEIGLVKISFGLLFDSLSAIMVVIILWISFFVHFYSLGYMSSDPFLNRFMSYLSLFTFFMLFLVTSDNFIQLFFGWEGVGVCSYLLINFWFTRILANKAALKAMIINRVADVFFIFSIVLILITFKTTDYVTVFYLIPFAECNILSFCGINFFIMDVICFFLFIGCIGKSAQILFHVWLPDAMEGPTPVSALLHAATMVTAGVFLTLRASFCFEYSSFVLFLIFLFGGITSFVFSLTAIFQYDIKKIIAYSTCSQPGYMFFSRGMSGYQVAIFHLFNHAFFKALLFLGAGVIIHAYLNNQDIRKIGSGCNFLILSFVCMLIGSLAIIGFPFLTGFYSKDLILELLYSRYIIDGVYVYNLAILSAFFTAIYSFRLFMYIFCFKSHTLFNYITKLSENENFMVVPVFCLAVLSIFVGYCCSDFFVGCGSFYWNCSFLLWFDNSLYIESEFIDLKYKLLPFILGVFAFCVVYIALNGLELACKKIKKIYKLFLFLNFFYSFFYNSWFINYLYNICFLFLFDFSIKIPFKLGDKGFFELFGPHGVYSVFRKLSYIGREFSPFIIFCSICFILVIVILNLFFLFIHVKILLFYTNNFALVGIGFLMLFNELCKNG
jgi:proton-translocating NADH-quinone oxidoreductase chain L